MVAARIPLSDIEATWSNIRESNGEMTRVVPSSAAAAAWKQIDFPEPVGWTASTSRRSAGIDVRASSSSLSLPRTPRCSRMLFWNGRSDGIPRRSQSSSALGGGPDRCGLVPVSAPTGPPCTCPLPLILAAWRWSWSCFRCAANLSLVLAGSPVPLDKDRPVGEQSDAAEMVQRRERSMTERRTGAMMMVDVALRVRYPAEQGS